MYGVNKLDILCVATHLTVFSCKLCMSTHKKLLPIYIVLPEKHSIVGTFWVRCSYWSMILIMDHQNNVSIAFPMSENLRLDNLMQQLYK